MGMEDEVLEEKDWTVEDYLALFDEQSPDTLLIRERSANLARITVRKVRTANGHVFEDTTFTEKTGAVYTIRTRL
jgi:hypothetical protein